MAEKSAFSYPKSLVLFAVLFAGFLITTHVIPGRVRDVSLRSWSTSPMVSALKTNLPGPLVENIEWNVLERELDIVVTSDDYCTRRNALTRAAGIAAGLSTETVMQPGFTAETNCVEMGSGDGHFYFVPDKVTICAGDSVSWANNDGVTHSIVFDEEAIPGGVILEQISSPEFLRNEGDTFTMRFDIQGEYNYYDENKRGAGMTGQLVVE